MTEMRLVMPDPPAVIPDLIRDPVPRDAWIAGHARNDTSGCNETLRLHLRGVAVNL